MRTRRIAVRVLLVDEDDRVLLLWHGPRHDPPHWAPPGGGIEPGEDLEQAARRELREEVGDVGDLDLVGPVWRWEHDYAFDGRPMRQHDTVFVARAAHFTPTGIDADLEDDGIESWRWWSAAELASCEEEMWPTALPSLLADVLAALRYAPDDITVVDLGTRSSGRLRSRRA